MKRIAPYLFMLLFVVGCDEGRPVSPPPDLSAYEFREGDVLLQHIPSHLGSVIRDIAESRYSHCGLVVNNGGRLAVIEAIRPVKYTSLPEWVGQGQGNDFTQLRPAGLSAEQLAQVAGEARKLLGSPYDLQYDLDENKIYCSELIYKAFLRGAKLKVGALQKLEELNWQPYENFIRHLAGGGLPLERVLVTPESLAKDENFKQVASNFPAAVHEPSHETKDLAGIWAGVYTIKGLDEATAEIAFDAKGKFLRGEIRSAGEYIRIVSVRVNPFKKQRAFVAVLQDSRGLTAAIEACFKDNRRRLIGTWKDSQGYTGVFSLERLTENMQE